MSIEDRRSNEVDEDEESSQQEGKDWQKRLEQGRSSWEGSNNLKKEDVKKKDEMVQALKEFQAKTGVNEEKYIKQLDKCTKRSQLNEMERKFKKAGTKWYRLQMEKSGLYEPLDVREEASLNQELESLTQAFEGLPLYGEFSMISTLNELQKTIEVKKAFRKKLKTQSKFIQSEYFRRLGSLALVGSREQLLNNVLKELKDVEDAPSAVQYEFKKKQKSAGVNKQTSVIKKEVMEEYKRRSDAYKKMVLDNQDYFGGEPTMTEFGKIPAAAAEFMEWFEDRESFAEMDDAAKKLPGLIKERKKQIEKRDKILENALPKDREKLTRKTDLMRRHELKEFMPELEQLVRNNSIHTAEYATTLLTARTMNVDLYEPLERSINIQKFKLNDLETQKAKLLVAKEEIEDRARTVREYFALPSYLRDDQRFLRVNAIERDKILFEARERAYREQTHPFDASHVDHMDGEEVQETAEKLRSEEGEDVMEDVMEEMKQEGLMKAADIQKNTHEKIFGASKKAETHQETQKEHYLRDLKYWVRMREDIKDESDVTTERERSKWRYIQAANEAYDDGYVFTSGGQVRHLEEIEASDLQNGGKLTEEKLKRARYGEHVQVKDKERKMARDPLEMIEKLSAQELMKLVLMAINKLGKGHMKLSDSNVQMLRNSPNIQKEISARIIEMEMTHMEDSEQLAA